MYQDCFNPLPNQSSSVLVPTLRLILLLRSVIIVPSQLSIAQPPTKFPVSDAAYQLPVVRLPEATVRLHHVQPLFATIQLKTAFAPLPAPTGHRYFHDIAVAGPDFDRPY